MDYQMNRGYKVVFMPGKLSKLKLPPELLHFTAALTLNLHKI